MIYKTISTKDFHAPNDFKKCFPLKHKLGCYGDCSDCRRVWFERIKKMQQLPFNVHDLKFDESWKDYEDEL